VNDRIDEMNDMTTEQASAAVPTPRRATRHLLWIAPLVLIMAVAAAWLLMGSGDGDGAPAAVATPDFEEVVVTDLTEVTTFNGTLGFDEGDSISSGMAGTLTTAVAEGEVVGEGGRLFTVDDEPVVLLYGDTTTWREMGLIPDLEQLVPRAAGTITWMAEEGTTLQQGDVLMRVNDEPIVVLYGDIPAYRTMRRNNEGTDVEQLEAAMVALGYVDEGDMTVDGDFTWTTETIVTDWQEAIGAPEDGRVDFGEVIFVPGPFKLETVNVAVGAQAGGGSPVALISYMTEGTEGADVLALEEALTRLGFDADGAMVIDGVFDQHTETAVKAWQESTGAEVDGIVGPGEIVFLPDAVRISDRLAEPGSRVNPGTPVLATSTDESVVTVALPAADQALFDEGDRVVVVLPDDTEVDATVQFKATTASITQQGNATFEVIIVLDDASAAEGLDQAPVDVEVITDRADGVMAVPVTALLALAEGGYAVEVEQADGTTLLVEVDPGMYADGMVEVTSDALQPGNRVVAP
jgi:peptidoglycan hydrolase-like protein with peptidoglycan-binding domain